MFVKFFFMLLFFKMSYALEDVKIIPVMQGRHIYTKEIELSSKEIAYFACEPILDEVRQGAWMLYRDLTDRMIQNYFYPALVVSRNGKLDSYVSKVFPNTQEHKNEFFSLIENVKDNKKMTEAIGSIKSGCAGMFPCIGRYITYVSKKPVNGFLPLPEYTDENYKMNLDTYIHFYENVVISVSSYPMENINQTGIYNHRGIFRNPWSMLKKDYAGIALLLHAFTGFAWSQEFPAVQFMTVNPDGNILMRSLLMNEFNADEMLVESLLGYENDPEKYEFYSKKFDFDNQIDLLEDSLSKPYISYLIRGRMGGLYIKIAALKKRVS